MTALLLNPVRGVAGRLLGFFVEQPVSPWVPIGVYLPLAVAAVVWNVLVAPPSLWLLIGLPVGGLLLWTVLEYFMHSRGFHSTLDADWVRALGKSHRLHHDHPSDPGHIFARLSFSLPVALVVWGLLSLVLWSAKLSALPMAGMIVGYLSYELVHYAIHRSKLFRHYLRPLVRHHLYHHHRDDGRCYGVTTPVWDWVFGTMPPSRTTEVD
jgi:sterol desaturase/sphingolipid hydroxylase (fatty acid hydroxylase superfamily)